MGRVFSEDGDILVRDGSRRVWDTNYPPVNWMPQPAWVTLSNYDFSYPDFSKGGGYGYERFTNPFGFDSDACVTCVTILPQSWDSGWSIVGSVPSGCNAIDVRGSIVRTKAPDNLLGITVPMNVPSGKEVNFPGGWCRIEREFSWSRTFEFRLNGTSIQFRRRQSTRASTNNPPWKQNWSDSFYFGWSHFGGAGAADGALAGIIQQSAGAMGAGTSRKRGGPLACSMNTSGFDFSSAYRANFTIRPGYIKP